MSRRLLIRADGSTAIGSGHVMRCLALAQAWRVTGGVSLFASTEIPPGLKQRILSSGDLVTEIPVVRGSPEDAVQTIAHARAHDAQWVVADGYVFDAAWQQAVRAAGLRLMVLDDCGHAERYHADIVLNQNFGASASLYGAAEPDTRLLLGCRYALLRQEFIDGVRPQRTFLEPARRVLVTLGGGDADNVTSKVISALQQLDDVDGIVVVGAANPHQAALRSLLEKAPRLKLVVDAPNMPELMAWADLAVTAAGSTSWEVAMMGLPAIQLVLADNQKVIASQLSRAGVTIDLGDARNVEVVTLAAGLRKLISDVEQRRSMSERAAKLVDGHGASRVVAALGAPLRLTLLSDANSWLNEYLPELKAAWEAKGHSVQWIHDPAQLARGDIAWFLSLSKRVPGELRRRHAHNLVVHESALPQGRGWSPLTWQVLEGKNEIPVTLLEAVEEVDAGDIYAQTTITLLGNELVGEMRNAQASATIHLCREFLAHYPFALHAGRAQSGQPSTYPRRRPIDSRLDPSKTLQEQFNLLRVSDPERYPTFFELGGRRYEVRVTAVDDARETTLSRVQLAREAGFTLLLTGAGGVAAPGLIDHLRRQRVRVVAADMNPRASGLVHADRGYRIPAAESAEFLPTMREICRNEGVNVIVPLVDEELMPLQQLATDSLHILTPTAEFIETCLDKHRLSLALARNGIAGPRTFLASEDFSALAYPVILKPRTGRGSLGVLKIDSPGEMVRALDGAAWTRDQLVVQEFIDGPEFTVSVVVWRDGSVQAVVPKEIIVKKGVTQMAVTRRHEGIDRICRHVQVALRADGPFNVQLRLDPRSGEPLPFEINPRFSTTVTHTMAAGIDELYGLARQAVYGVSAYRFGTWREDLLLRRRSVDEFLPEKEYLAEQQLKLCAARS